MAECSAKTNQGVIAVFEELVRQVSRSSSLSSFMLYLIVSGCKLSLLIAEGDADLRSWTTPLCGPETNETGSETRAEWTSRKMQTRAAGVVIASPGAFCVCFHIDRWVRRTMKSDPLVLTIFRLYRPVTIFTSYMPRLTGSRVWLLIVCPHEECM